MKFIYVANSRIPTERAHGLQIMKMCGQFAKNSDVELILPRRFNPIKDDPFVYYGVNKNFKIIRLPVLDLVKFGRFGFWLESLNFSKIAVLYLLLKKTDIIYGRDELPLFFLSFFKKNIFFEVHQGRINLAVKRLLKNAEGIITISGGLKDFYIKHGASEEKIITAPDAVDFDIFNISVSKEESRRRLNLPPDKKIILYSGHLYDWKGANILAEAAKNLDKDILTVFIGGADEDIIDFKKSFASFENILIKGHQPYREIPLWLKAADVLVLPNSAKYEISRSFTSPMKLFEYMASGTPIIASDLPSIREILIDSDSLFFKPDDVRDLADKIKYAFANYDEMRSKAVSAKQKAAGFTWSKRAENIISFISQKRLAGEKSDFWPALFVGIGTAILSLPTIKNISLFDSVFYANRGFLNTALVLWLIMMPAGAVAGIFLARKIGVKNPVIFQLAKYGLVGWLNVFMYAGIFNLLSWLSGVASGWIADFFLVVSFVVTTTNAFFWNKLWTFRATDSGNGKTEYAKFFTVTGITSGLNILLFHLMVNTIGAPAGFDEKLWANIAIFALIPVSLLGNFFGFKIFVFKGRKDF